MYDGTARRGRGGQLAAIRLRMASPPSSNNLYRNIPNVGRAKTSAYKGWQKTEIQGARLASRGVRMPERAPLAVEIRAGIDRRRDIDNCAKPVIDTLQASRVIADDRWVDRLLLLRAPEVGRGWVEVSVSVAE